MCGTYEPTAQESTWADSEDEEEEEEEKKKDGQGSSSTDPKTSQ